MSRGYGILQRRIVAALSKPDACTSTHILCQTIYRDQYFGRGKSEELSSADTPLTIEIEDHAISEFSRNDRPGKGVQLI